jgi:DNA-binding NtrC family response regulator
VGFCLFDYGSATQLPSRVTAVCASSLPLTDVRELENTMERAVALARGSRVELEDLPGA